VALFQWIRSIDIDEAQTEIRVHPSPPLRLAHLEGFPLGHQMALKAFLEHETLTVPEYASIDDRSVSKVEEIFESLGNALLIEPASSDMASTVFHFEAVDPGVRYRLRPLLTHAVISLLRERNIVH